MREANRCPVCERFIFVHTDEEAAWCYDLYRDRNLSPEETSPPPKQESWLDLPIHRDSIH